MKFLKIIKSDKHTIPTALLDALVDTAMKTTKFAKDMKSANVTLSLEQREKIKELADIISDKFDEIRNNII